MLLSVITATRVPPFSLPTVLYGVKIAQLIYPLSVDRHFDFFQHGS